MCGAECCKEQMGGEEVDGAMHVGDDEEIGRRAARSSSLITCSILGASGCEIEELAERRRDPKKSRSSSRIIRLMRLGRSVSAVVVETSGSRSNPVLEIRPL